MVMVERSAAVPDERPSQESLSTPKKAGGAAISFGDVGEFGMGRTGRQMINVSIVSLNLAFAAAIYFHQVSPCFFLG